MHRRRGIVLVVVVALAAVAAWLVLPPLAFHLLPPGVTGEAGRLARLLDASPGKTIAEIGAGTGALTVEIARRVGSGGRVYSNELSADRRADIRARVTRSGLDNVIVVEGLPADANLPVACCDAAFMRNVYHHLGDVRAFNASLRRALRPGGRLVVIDFAPARFFHLPGRPAESAGERTGHGVSPPAVVAELDAAGFALEREIPDWGGRLFLLLFRAADRLPS